MSLDIKIKDGVGSSYLAQVTRDNALKVSAVDVATQDQTVADLTRKKQYRDWLRTEGGSPDMNVDGSVSPVTFSETAEPGRVKWVLGWRLIITGTYLELETNDFRRFGLAAIAPGLTNGLEFYFNQGGVKIDVFLSNVQKIGDFMLYADDAISLVNAVGAQEDYLQFEFSFDVPIALPAGSNDKIVMTVADDLTPIDYMRAIVRGYQEIVDF